MQKNFFDKLSGTSDIEDTKISVFSGEIDGDIVVSNSYKKRAKKIWKNTFRLKFLVYSQFLVFGFLFIKLYYLQIVRGAEYYGTAEGNRIKTISIIPTRGVIFDENLIRLAYNEPDFALFVIPSKLPKEQEKEDEIFKAIEDCLNLEHFDLVEAFARIPRTSFEEIEIARGISQEQAVLLSKYTEKWDSISLVSVQQRTYEYDEMLSHVLGYTGKISDTELEYYKKQGYLLTEHVGKSGIEKEYQENLRGEPGALVIEVDSKNKPIRELDKKNPILGESLFLGIDSELQKFIWEELKKIEENLKTPGASVIVMDPNTGLIKALVSYPGFDIEKFSRGIDAKTYKELLEDERNPLFFRAISGEYPSGSTIKLVIGAAALQDKVVSRYTSVLSTGGIRVNEYFFPDWRAGGHGQTDIVRAISESVNTYFYAVGGGWGDISGLGPERMKMYGEKFGLGEKTGIDIPSEAKGFLPSKEWKEKTKGEKWYLGDTYHMAIGQGDVLVTPIQVANFTATISNGGTLYAPHVVEKIGKDYVTAKKIEPKILNKDFMDPYNITIIQQGLRQAVISGTARSLSSLSMDAAGKTGTAQFSSKNDPHAWFTGYAPYKNPEIVVTVLIEQGKGGDISATPLAKKIFEWYFKEKETHQY